MFAKPEGGNRKKDRESDEERGRVGGGVAGGGGVVNASLLPLHIYIWVTNATRTVAEAKELVLVTVQGFSRNVGLLDPDDHQLSVFRLS